MRLGLLRALVSAFGGGLFSLSLPPVNQAWMAWFSLVPVLAAVMWRRPGLGVGALCGFAWGCGAFLPSFHWLTTVTAPGWFFLCLYLALYPALWGLFAAWVLRARAAVWERKLAKSEAGAAPELASPFLSSRSNLLLAVQLSAAWVTVEWLRNTVFTGFGWNSLAISQTSQLTVIQFAEFTGAAGVSFLVAMVNVILLVTVVRFVMEVRGGRLRAHFDYTVTMALVALAFVHGIVTLQRPLDGEVLRVAAVQANIPQDEKWDPASAGGIYAQYTRLTELAIAWGPDLLIWPEASTPYSYYDDRQTYEFIRKFAKETRGSFLLGNLEFTVDSEGAEQDYNVAMLFNGVEGEPQIYRKVHLVPFGEYVPLRKTFPLFDRIIGDRVPSDFASGNEPLVLTMEEPRLQLAALICFEDTVGRLTRRFVVLGADLLITLTNDGWFKTSPGAEVHFRNSIFRTIENRRPLVRAANTGVTCVIDPHGRILQELRTPEGSPFMDGLMMTEVQVPKAPPLTLYTRFGEWFAVLCILISLTSAVWAVWRLRTGRDQVGV